MAHGSFKVLDSDIHVIEPPDLWPQSRTGSEEVCHGDS